MMRTVWPTLSVLALLVGISGCFPYTEPPRAIPVAGEPAVQARWLDCWRPGSDWSCLRGTTEHAAIFAW